MRNQNFCFSLIVSLFLTFSLADEIVFKDGTVMKNCFLRDEGIEILVWNSLDEVGGPGKTYPRSAIKSFQIIRDEKWDYKPPLTDLTITFIELNPKLAGLHGRVNYDIYGRPIIGGGKLPKLPPDEGALHPEKIVKNLKLKYKEGEEITLSAHIKNVGFAPSQPFRYHWLIDGVLVKEGEYKGILNEMEEATVSLKWKWRKGFHYVTFRILTNQKEIATINNCLTVPLWGWGLVFIVNKKRVEAWHQVRNAYGTFSFEDYYRWHIDIMNKLFQKSVFPSAPNGIIARVRLDRIIYTDDVEKAHRELVSPDGLAYHQGCWVWSDSEEEKKGNWQPPDKEWRTQTEWSLPHELGHQLGLTDLYFLDYQGDENHTMPDNGEKITHFMTHPITMMHWHGPHIFSEIDAGYLNMTYDKPRGHFGDHYFAIPRENFLRIVDINGNGVPNARVEIYQRGIKVDESKGPAYDHGVCYFPVVEDGDFSPLVSRVPVIVGYTDKDGLLRLPNRPVKEVRTLNGFHRRPNPFGNINVVGERGLLLVKVIKGERPSYFWLEIYDFVVAWFRGNKDKFTIVLKTPYASIDSPLPPKEVKVTKIDKNSVKITWKSPQVIREQQYLDRPIGFRVYRRISNDGLNDRPWFPVGTISYQPDEDIYELTVDLQEYPQDIYWFSNVNRFGVSTIGECGKESELIETILND
ncbi:fibronectin type III domain-containing protein [bacterium]|nr:fibronectin type III domain-containing protein [bacterium]